MNIGTANKWIDLLLKDKRLCTLAGSLRTLDDDVCALGVLQDFIEPDGWVRNEYTGHYLTSEGSFARLTENVKKKGKLKNSDPYFTVFIEGQEVRVNLVAAWDSGRFDAYRFSGLIEEFYAEL